MNKIFNLKINKKRMELIKEENLLSYKEYDTIKEFGKTTSDLKVIEKGEPIFLRLDANEEIEYIKNKMKE